MAAPPHGIKGPIRAVVYARYSSENQHEASIDDQVEICRRYIERQGWTLVHVYDDAAVSGASKVLQPGFQRMRHDAETRRFDILVCEAIDRPGRKLSDVAKLFDHLSFLGIQVHATSVGQVMQMHIGIMGTMAQMALADLREKTRRGQLGRARAGKVPGGRAYGYDVVSPLPGAKGAGDRRINDAEADVVRRIFREYAAGVPPRHIARRLNDEGVPAPDGRAWGDTTIRSQVDRGTGILNNTLYIGQLSWDRCSYVKDPRTGKRVARPRTPDQWETAAVPALRIVDQALWDAVKARQHAVRIEIGRDDDGNALNRAHRRAFLLSGLLTCGCCGGAFTVIRLLAPELVAEFLRAFAEETTQTEPQAVAQQEHLSQQLSDVERRLDGVVRAIEGGAWSDTLRERLAELESRKASLREQLETASRPARTIQLHPNAAEIYRARVAELEALLNEPEVRAEASDVLRGLIDRLVLTRMPMRRMACGSSSTATLRRSWRLVKPRTASPETIQHEAAFGGRPRWEHLFLGVNCRWLRGQDLNL